MISLPTAELQCLCRKYGVKRLWLFGSAASGRFDSAKSDIDLLVDFGDPPAGISISAQYFDFWEELKQLFTREVDLVERDAIKNPYFKDAVEEEQVLVYAA